MAGNFKLGRLLVSTSGSGQSGSFEVWAIGKEFTQDNVFALIQELYEVLVTTLANDSSLSDNGEQANSDAIYLAMCGDQRLTTINETGTDVTLIGWPSAVGGGFA